MLKQFRVEELQVGETTIKNDSEGNITFVNTFNPTQTINVGIGTVQRLMVSF